jgi:hypothetical protein
MPCGSIPYKVYIKRGKEDRRVGGRPRERWIDNIKETMQEHQMTIIKPVRKAKTGSLYLRRHPKDIRGRKNR